MKNYIISIMLGFFLVGCASNQTTSTPTYSGPTAKISDFGLTDDGKSGVLFYVASIDGMDVETSATSTRKASSNHGLGLRIALVEHVIPVHSLKLKLVGTSVTGAPIHEIFKRSTGTFYSVEGEVKFAPVEGHQYFVTGKLQKERSSVWIADAENENIPVSDIIESPKN